MSRVQLARLPTDLQAAEVHSGLPERAILADCSDPKGDVGRRPAAVGVGEVSDTAQSCLACRKARLVDDRIRPQPAGRLATASATLRLSAVARRLQPGGGEFCRRKALGRMELSANQECVASSRRSGDGFEFLTVLEIATVLRVNPQTVRNWIRHGALPAVKLGRCVRIRRSDLETYLEASRVEPPGTPRGSARRDACQLPSYGP